MSISLTYPGIRIQEMPSGVKTIVGVGTSITAFVGTSPKGPLNKPTMVNSFPQYASLFGGLDKKSSMGYSVMHYFMNMGKQAVIVRIDDGSDSAILNSTESGMNAIGFRTSSPGNWGKDVAVYLEPNAEKRDDGKDKTVFNLYTIIMDDENKYEPDPADPSHLKNWFKSSTVVETYFNLSTDPNSTRYLQNVIDNQSNFIRANTVEENVIIDKELLFMISDPNIPLGGTLSNNEILNNIAPQTGEKEGIYALEKIDLFNMLCIPPISEDVDMYSIYPFAISFCDKRRAMFIVDCPQNPEGPPFAGVVDAMKSIRHKNATAYFPNLLFSDPLDENRVRSFSPSGAVAGVIARTDVNRGVWKTPAGVEANIIGCTGLQTKLTDEEHGILNPLGINCARDMGTFGTLVYGGRTLRGSDALADQWKYLSVRRTALYIEESLFRGTQWALFEPNDEPLWAQIRLSIGSFMHDLFLKGAFQGSKPSDAYLVDVGPNTTSQFDIDRGLLYIVVGFAPLKPAEFIIIKIQQLAGRSQ